MDFIRGFTPARRFFGPSAEDLASELAGAVSASPQRFTGDLAGFYELRPNYLEGLPHGFRGAAEAERVFDLCIHILNQPKGEDDGVWRGARREVVDPLHDGFILKGAEIPFEFRDRAWTLLVKLVEDPDPTPEDEAQLLSRGAYHVAINSTRGRAIEAAVFYWAWLYRHSKPPGTEPFMFSLEEAPELKTVLERHLDPVHDPSLAVRTVYGVFLPTLYALDATWIKENLAQLFPADEQLEQLRNAGWDAYACYSRFNLSILGACPIFLGKMASAGVANKGVTG